MTGLEAKRHMKIMTHTVSSLQLVEGEDRRVHHCIALARDAINAAGKSRLGCGMGVDFPSQEGFVGGGHLQDIQPVQ